MRKEYNRKPNTTCKVCAKPIYRRPKVIRTSQAVYCSRQCYRIATAPVLKQCLTCKKLFKPGRSYAKFCSHTCANIARRGITYSKDSYTNKSKKRLALLKAIFKFEYCMVEGCSYNKTFDIHRLVTGKEKGRYEIGNMFAICPNHHAEVTRGIIKLEKISDNKLRITPGG